jgi:hydroxycarboxylate dehydrogenase B
VSGVRFAVAGLKDWAGRLLTAVGAPRRVANVVARHLVDADAAGHPSHGLRMLPVYRDQLRDGELVAEAEPVVVRDLRAHLVIDARRGFGHYALDWTLHRAVEKARSSGVATANIVRCGHTGRLGGHLWSAAEAGCAVLVCGGTIGDDQDALVVPPGGREKVLDTNPIAFGYPGRPPFLLDMATSATAYYDVLETARRGGAVEPGVVLDSLGRPTTDAGELLRGGSLAPFGGFKGYGLSMMAALLGGAAGSGRETSTGGVFLMVLGPDVLAGGAAHVTALERVRSSAPVDGGPPVAVPGDRSRARAAEAEVTGLPLPPRLWQRLAERWGTELPPLPQPLPGSPDTSAGAGG